MTELLQNYIAANGIRRRLFRSALVKLPRPRCFVMFEGKADDPAVSVQKLSSAFGGDDTVLELKVIVININRLGEAGGEWKNLSGCRHLTDYVFFMNLIDEYKKTLPPKQAVQRANDECRRQGIMLEYLEKKGNEVFDMLAFQWNEEEARQAWREEGFDIGMEKGREKSLLQSIRNLMSSLKLSARKAMEALAIPPDEYEKYDKLLLAQP